MTDHTKLIAIVRSWRNMRGMAACDTFYVPHAEMVQLLSAAEALIAAEEELTQLRGDVAAMAPIVRAAVEYIESARPETKVEWHRHRLRLFGVVQALTAEQRARFGGGGA